MDKKQRNAILILLLMIALTMGSIYGSVFAVLWTNYTTNQPIKAQITTIGDDTKKVEIIRTHVEYMGAGISREIEKIFREIREQEKKGINHEKIKILKVGMIYPINPIKKEKISVESPMYVTNTPSLNKRAEDSVESEVVAVASIGEEVYVEQKIETFEKGELVDSWCELDDGTFVKSEYLTEDTLIPLGECIITYYCSCAKCCGWSNHPTASGVYPEEGVTIATDPSIPFGTIVVIDGHEYTVQDRGSSIYGNHIDMYLNNHDSCLDKGIEYKEVYIKK